MDRCSSEGEIKTDEIQADELEFLIYGHKKKKTIHHTIMLKSQQQKVGVGGGWMGWG